MKSHELNKARKFLGLSQQNMARLLETSIRSVQAYEQGWRAIPTHVERMVLYLLYQKCQGQRPVKPCWEIKNCSDQWRDLCPAWNFQATGPCWFINGCFCDGRNHRSWGEKMKACRACSVFICVMGDIIDIING